VLQQRELRGLRARAHAAAALLRVFLSACFGIRQFFVSERPCSKDLKSKVRAVKSTTRVTKATQQTFNQVRSRKINLAPRLGPSHPGPAQC